MKKKELKDNFRRVGNMIEYHGNRLDTLERFAEYHPFHEKEVGDRLDFLKNKLQKLEQQIADIELMRKRIDELEKQVADLAEKQERQRDNLIKANSVSFDKYNELAGRIEDLDWRIELLRNPELFEKARKAGEKK